MKNLYIDFDGVILDTIRLSYDTMKELNIDPSSEEGNEFYKNLDWKTFIASAPQINDSFACIEKIIESKRFHVAILTHVISLGEAVEKVHYIRKYLKDITIIPVPKQVSKTKMVPVKDAILIDDYTENLRQWKEAGGIGVRFSMNLNGKGFPAIDRLDQILDIIKEDI